MRSKIAQLILVLISALIVTLLLPGMWHAEHLLMPAVVPFLAFAPIVALGLLVARRWENRLRSALILAPALRRKSDFRDF